MLSHGESERSEARTWLGINGCVGGLCSTPLQKYMGADVL